MKVSILALSGLILLQPGWSQDQNFHIYLLFGQSNMEGMGTVETQDRLTNSRVQVLQDQTCTNLNRNYGTWYTAAPPLNRCWSGIGPGDSFGKTMAENTPASVTIGLVPASVAGCDIALYQKSAPIGRANSDIPTQFSGGYAWLLDLAKKAKTVGVIRGILFHQGETNTGDQNWKYKVEEIVADLKTDLGIGDVPFLAGELLYSEYQSCCARHNVEINKLPSIIPNSYIISAANLPGKDEAHFTSASYREFGKRYAQKMLTLVNVPCEPTKTTSMAKVGSGEWGDQSKITVDSGATIQFGPHPWEGGAWQWKGCNLAGTDREQSLQAKESCEATATFMNECGESSEATYSITVIPPQAPVDLLLPRVGNPSTTDRPLNSLQDFYINGKIRL